MKSIHFHGTANDTRSLDDPCGLSELGCEKAFQVPRFRVRKGQRLALVHAPWAVRTAIKDHTIPALALRTHD
jgi:hypothetical protein